VIKAQSNKIYCFSTFQKHSYLQKKQSNHLQQADCNTFSTVDYFCLRRASKILHDIRKNFGRRIAYKINDRMSLHHVGAKCPRI